MKSYRLHESGNLKKPRGIIDKKIIVFDNMDCMFDKKKNKLEYSLLFDVNK